MFRFLEHLQYIKNYEYLYFSISVLASLLAWTFSVHQYSAILHQQFLSTSPRPANLLACNDRPLCGMVVVYYAAGTAVQAIKGKIGIMAINYYQPPPPPQFFSNVACSPILFLFLLKFGISPPFSLEINTLVPQKCWESLIIVRHFIH